MRSGGDRKRHAGCSVLQPASAPTSALLDPPAQDGAAAAPVRVFQPDPELQMTVVHFVLSRGGSYAAVAGPTLEVRGVALLLDCEQVSLAKPPSVLASSSA